MCPTHATRQTHEMGSIFGNVISAVLEVVSALVFDELIEGATSELPEFSYWLRPENVIPESSANAAGP
jgi:hypothetical protein